MVVRTKTMFGEGHMTDIDNGQSPYEIENELIDLLDALPMLEKYQAMFADLCKGTIDVPAAMKQMAVPALMELVNAMHSAEPKLRAQIAQDFLDRAGYGKTTKVATVSANIDMDDSKTELVHFIMSAAKRSGIDVIEGEVVEEKKVDITKSRPVKHKRK